MLSLSSLAMCTAADLVHIDLEKEIVKNYVVSHFGQIFWNNFCSHCFEFNISDLQVSLTSIYSLCADIKSIINMWDNLGCGIITGS